MLITRRKTGAGIVLTGCLLMGSVCGLAVGQPGAQEVKLNAKTFAQLQKQIKPQPGESRWMEVLWFLDLHEARQKAAAEGKPLFIYSTGGATGIGAC